MTLVLPSRILVIRHAESEGNTNGDIYKITPDWKIGLSKKGYEDAVGKNLSCVDPTIFSSPMLRATETSKLLFPGLEVIEEPRLREQGFGNYAYAPDALMRERSSYGKFFYKIENGESCADVYDRCCSFLNEIRFMEISGDMVLVTHGITALCLIMKLCNWTVSEFHNHKTPRNLEVVELEWYSGKYVLKTELRRRK